MIRVSAGSASVLGLKQVRLDAAPTTAYLMCGTQCSRSCAFCAQGRDSTSRADMLSRVTWPDFPAAEAAAAIARAYREGAIKRACIQVVMGDRFVERTQEIIRLVKASSEIPLCVSVSGNEKVVRAMFEAGADRVAIPLDAASEEAYTRCKGKGWNAALGLIKASARQYPGKIGTHVIVGLGETDSDLLWLFQEMRDCRVTIGLFAFTPVRGTPMEDSAPPPLERYRAIQAARYLIEQGRIRIDQAAFSDGRLVSFGLDDKALKEALDGGEAFRTSGCPDCNRPYYNERPGGPVYNYPRPLEAGEATRAICEVLRWIRGQSEEIGEL